MPYVNLPLKTKDGDAYALNGSYVSDDQMISDRPTIIMFHGNGGNHGHRGPLAKIFYMRFRCNVLMMSYRGYGKSEGSPSEKGLQIDAQTALDYLMEHVEAPKIPRQILYGQSIGGAVSIDFASRNPTKISALILENTFTSLPALIPHAMPALSSVSFLCHQKWESINKIPLIPAATPILMLSGMLDEIVPKEHMRALWEAVTKRGEKTSRNSEGNPAVERARYMEFDLGDTVDDTVAQPGYWAAILEFIGSLGYPMPREKRV
ncbi:Alpha/Beta hydrolase protein [Coprinopsis sp. MPI-PUGE-AT-0042]|nr:Alpha/Beta hydrolase protein [Coprinopsis sp. MPI-PUGE-AT-0042]